MSRDIEQQLRFRFQALCEAIGKELGGSILHADVLFDQLAQKYAEPHRRYHTLMHIADGLHWLHEVRPMVDYPLALELAWWYHDVVYDPQSRTNEADSARFVRLAWGATNILPVSTQHYDIFWNVVESCILATRHLHTGLWATRPIEHMLIADIDLSVLAEHADVFGEYEQGIREEYRHCSDSEFAEGRATFLRKLLQRPQIFSHPYFYLRLEARAQDNILRSFRGLTA